MKEMEIDSTLSREEIADNLVKYYRMKDKIRVDLKLSGLHRDLLRMIRGCIT